MKPQELEQLIHSYLDKASNDEPEGMSDETLDKAAASFRETLKRRFARTTEPKQPRNPIRLSSLGKPLCQLIKERDRADTDRNPYTLSLKFAMGDVYEAIILAILESIDVDITSQSKQVVYRDEEIRVPGTLDVDIDGIYDIKSASTFSYQKFSKVGGLQSEYAEDPFGYVTQLISYSLADERSARGWIVINKDTSEITVCPVRVNESDIAKTRKTIRDNVTALKSSEDHFVKLPGAPEMFRKKLTGNTRLPMICSYCSYKTDCRGDEIERHVQFGSSAAKPPYVEYLHILPENREKMDQKQSKLRSE